MIREEVLSSSSAKPRWLGMKHSVRIAASPEEVYRLINAVEEWPSFFPPCREARTVDVWGSERIVEISASVAGEIRTWRSRRLLHPGELRIEFEQINPYPPLRAMTGYWQVAAAEVGMCTVTLMHAFVTSEADSIRMSSPLSCRDAEVWIRSACDRNSEAELRALKRRCEGDRVDSVMGTHPVSFSDELGIYAPPQAIYTLLWDVGNWPQILPHVRSVELLEESGTRQRFRMQSGTAERTTVTESVRIGRPFDSIDYSQVARSDLLDRHDGRWELVEKEGVTRLSSSHWIELSALALGGGAVQRDPQDTQQAIREAISAHSWSTLDVLRSRLEAAQH